MSRRRFHGLKRVKVRMTWNKYNLYNLSRLRSRPHFGTFFQQKWASKSASRAYHGEQIREKQWQRMFTSRLNAVIPMEHRYLAENDGSELAAGRGSGLETKNDSKFRKSPKMPYMAMTYAPIERRLDVAVFRALFASSARQARQFVTHGSVKVNGQKMPYPGYLLNPGDMFQVEPERVLFATGQAKTPEQIKKGRERRKTQREVNARRHEKRMEARAQALKNAAAKIAANKREAVASKPRPEPAEPAGDVEARKQRRSDLQALVTQVKGLMENTKNPPSAKKKQELRKFTKDVRQTMASVNRKPIDDLDGDLAKLVDRLTLTTGKSLPVAKTLGPTPAANTASDSKTSSAMITSTVSNASKQRARKLLQESRQNLIDESKPYATPWRPRPYMSAFAFVPRYLEVNHKICSAVYLRHPVARPGLSEVPTPFSADTMQLAFNWYLRRR